MSDGIIFTSGYIQKGYIQKGDTLAEWDRVIVNDPEARLVFSDWLEERGAVNLAQEQRRIAIDRLSSGFLVGVS